MCLICSRVPRKCVCEVSDRVKAEYSKCDTFSHNSPACNREVEGFDECKPAGGGVCLLVMGLVILQRVTVPWLEVRHLTVFRVASNSQIQ